MNVRQQLYKKFRLSGMNAYQSAVKAGYSHNTAIHAYTNIEKRLNFDDLMVKHGLDDESLLGVLKQGVQVKGMTGEPTAVTKGFLEIAFKLKGKLKDSGGKEQLNITNGNNVQILIINEGSNDTELRNKEERGDNQAIDVGAEAISRISQPCP